ncbi:MAG: hypothetical protein CM15mP74_30690 [Halieaceae bacterium]|nr:MAG: hypothetical protein CM15mP74_30690 [Halieaceae bacterium]
MSGESLYFDNLRVLRRFPPVQCDFMRLIINLYIRQLHLSIYRTASCIRWIHRANRCHDGLMSVLQRAAGV